MIVRLANVGPAFCARRVWHFFQRLEDLSILSAEASRAKAVELIVLAEGGTSLVVSEDA